MSTTAPHQLPTLPPIPAGLTVRRIERPGHNPDPETRALRVTFDRGRTRYVATLEIRTPGGGLSPGFSITGEVYEPHGTWSGQACQRNGREPDGCGAMGDTLARVLPFLAPFERVHLADLDGTPMHGPSNAAYIMSPTSLQYEARYYGPSWTERHGTGLERAAGILRVDTIPAAAIEPVMYGSGDIATPFGHRPAEPAWSNLLAECREQWAYDAHDATRVFDALWAHALAHDVAQVLRTINPDEPGGDWSAWDVARKLDPFPETFGNPERHHVMVARDSLAEWVSRVIRAACPNGGRYVGGTSAYLYSLPPLGTYSVDPLTWGDPAHDDGDRFAVVREHDGQRTRYGTERTRKDAEHVAAYCNANQPNAKGDR